MPSLMTTTVLEIAYRRTLSGFDYHVRLDGLWVASATTNHAADLVADEVQYRMFLSIPIEPDPDDHPGEDTDGVPSE